MSWCRLLPSPAREAVSRDHRAPACEP